MKSYATLKELQMADRRIDITEVAFIFGKRELTIRRWRKNEPDFPEPDERGTFSELEINLWAGKTGRRVLIPARG